MLPTIAHRKIVDIRTRRVREDLKDLILLSLLLVEAAGVERLFHRISY